MREDQTIPDTTKLPAHRINEVLEYRLLNGSREDGPHTIILRSQPRPPAPRRGQYHTTDEEFLVLGGDFTFDGSNWFSRGSYVFYPAWCIHGTNVNVRGGYEVYLRVSGTTETLWEDEPKSDAPYPADGVTLSSPPLQMLSVPGKAPRITSTPQGIVAHRLRGESDAGSALVSLNSGQRVAVKCDDLVEIFVVSGRFESGSNSSLDCHGYLARTGRQIIELSCVEAGELLISHEAGLSFLH